MNAIMQQEAPCKIKHPDHVPMLTHDVSAFDLKAANERNE